MNDSELNCIQLSLVYNDTNANSPDVTTATAVFQVLLHVLLLPASAVINSLLIILIARTNQLHTAPLFLAVQVVCANLSGEVVTALSIFSSAGGNGWVLGWQACAINAFLVNVSAFTRAGLILTLAVTHFLYVFVPHAYSKIHKTMVTILSVASWSIGIACAIVFVPGALDCYIFRSDSHYCTLGDQCSPACSRAVAVIWSLVGVPTYLGSFALYCCLFCKACYLRRTSRADQSRRITKAIVTFFFISFITILFTWPLPAVTEVVKKFTTSGSEIPAIVLMLASNCLNDLVAIIDPIFIFRNEDVKKALKVFVRRHVPFQSRMKQ